MALIVWLSISLLCLIVFLIVNRWMKWVEYWEEDMAFFVIILCIFWPIGILLFVCMIGAKIIVRFLP